MSKHQKLKTICLTPILLFLVSVCSAQNTNYYPCYVKKIHQDSISINASTLPEFRNDVHDTDYQGNQISGVIRTVFQDRKGDFWFGTQNGLCRHDKNGLFYFDIKDWREEQVVVYVVLEDTNGNIWIGFSGGIAKYDGTFFTMYYQKDILINSGLWSMTMDTKGLLWIGSTLGVYTFDGKALLSFEIPEGKINSNLGISSTKMIHSIIEDRKGNMWFSTNGGVYIYDGITLKNISEKDGLPSNFVGQIIESSNGFFWISTSKGICKYDGKTITHITKEFIKNEDSMGCIFEDKNGVVWFTMNKREMYTYNRGSFTKIESKIGDFSLFPFSIYEDNKARLWFVGLKGAYRYEDNGFINVNRNGPW